MALYKSLVRPHLEYGMQFWRPHLQKDVNRMESVQRVATKMISGLHYKAYEDRLKDLNMYTLEERQDRGDMIEMFKYLHGINVQGESLFQLKASSATRGHGMRVKGDRFRSDMRKYFFTERVVDPWNSLPVEVVEMRTVTEFKKAWDQHRGSLKVKSGLL